MSISIWSIQLVLFLLLSTSVVSSYIFCSWRPTNLDTGPNAQLSFQCTDPSTPIIIIENAAVGFAYNNMDGKCPTFIGCSQQVPDFAQYCTGNNTSCSINQKALFTPYANPSCNTAYLNYVYVNYSCIAANVPPYDICNSQQSLTSTGLTYLSTSNSFPLSTTFPYAPIQCSCSFKPLDQTVTANISIRALIVELWDFTSCSQNLTIRSCPNNDTVFCSRSVSSNLTSYVQLEANPSISFQSSSTSGHFLLEIRTLTSSISGTIGSLTCSRQNIETQPCDNSSTNNPWTSESFQTTLGQPTNKQTSAGDNSGIHQTSPKPANATCSKANSTLSTTDTVSVLKSVSSASDKKTNDISSGAIAGIVIGCAVLVILLIVLIVVMKYRWTAAKRLPDQTAPSKEFVAGIATNLQSECIEHGSFTDYAIPASRNDPEMIKSGDLTTQPDRIQEFEMKKLPDEKSDNKEQSGPNHLGSNPSILMSMDTDSCVANNQLLSANMRSRKLTDSELVLVDNTLYLDGAEIQAITDNF